MAKIIAIGLANPEMRLTQEESWLHLNRLRKLTPLENKYYKKFMLDDGIQARYLALEKLEDIFCNDQDQIIERYNTQAPKLAAKAVLKALEKASLNKESLAYLATASCTGYLCPGLSSYIIEKVGLRSDITAIDIQGMGCGAALPTLSSAEQFISSNRQIAYSIINCTELCSSAIYWESDLGLILSNSIFGDGSASVVLTNDPAAAGPEILDYASVTFPDKRDELRFTIKQGKLRNLLASTVPEIAAKGVKKVVEDLLKRNNLKKSAIRFWALHTGGRKVLSVIAEKMGLSAEDIHFSVETLRDYGNMSSPSVLFALEKILASNLPQTGDYGILLSFGAGFSCYGMLVKW